jgi:hypothetical protein
VTILRSTRVVQDTSISARHSRERYRLPLTTTVVDAAPDYGQQSRRRPQIVHQYTKYRSIHTPRINTEFGEHGASLVKVGSICKCFEHCTLYAVQSTDQLVKSLRIDVNLGLGLGLGVIHSLP